MQVEVIPEDIANGVRRDCNRCALARALERQTGERWKVDTPDAVDSRGRHWPLPVEAIRFMARFDHGLFVGPFVFEMEESPEKKRRCRG